MHNRLLSIAVGAAIATLSTYAGAALVLTSVGGSNAASIQSSVDSFRASLGVLNPNVAGSFAGGRREINWDGVPDAFSRPNALPGNFFNVNSPRGAVFSTPGTSLAVSADSSNPSNATIEFGDISPNNVDIFATFSAQRLFTSLGSNVIDIRFFVPGSSTPATTNGFGAIFTDVDLASTTSIQFFDAGDLLLLSSFVSPATVASEGFSFLGAMATAGERISRVRITSGNEPLGVDVSENAAIDLVVLDDFIYGEPLVAPAVIPEPETSALMLAALGLMGAVLRRRRGAQR